MKVEKKIIQPLIWYLVEYHLVYPSSIVLYSAIICLLQDGKTALHFAAEKQRLDVCELLLKAGAPADAQDKVWLSISIFHQMIVFILYYSYYQNR